MVRYTFNYLLSKPKVLGDSHENIKALTDSTFTNQFYDYTQKEIDRIKDSVYPEDKLNRKVLTIFKSALKLSDEDIKTLDPWKASNSSCFPITIQQNG